jgi:glycosyltransferase involved in cell wall biosynthesis
MKSVPVFVIVPAHNEARTIGKVIAKITQFCPTARTAVINDGSVDDTEYEATHAGASVINLPFNAGYGVALQTGFIWAKRQGARVVVTLDADGQHDPAEIRKILTPVVSGDADLALGSRYLDNGCRYRIPVMRRFGAWAFAKVVSRLMNQVITDPTTGFQCLNSKVLDLYVGLSDFPDKTPDADLILYAHFQACRIVEVPVAMYADEGTDSMHGFFKSMFYGPKMLIAMLGIVLARTVRKEP